MLRVRHKCESTRLRTRGDATKIHVTRSARMRRRPRISDDSRACTCDARARGDARARAARVYHVTRVHVVTRVPHDPRATLACTRRPVCMWRRSRTRLHTRVRIWRRSRLPSSPRAHPATLAPVKQPACAPACASGDARACQAACVRTRVRIRRRSRLPSNPRAHLATHARVRRRACASGDARAHQTTHTRIWRRSCVSCDACASGDARPIV